MTEFVTAAQPSQPLRQASLGAADQPATTCEAPLTIDIGNHNNHDNEKNGEPSTGSIGTVREIAKQEGGIVAPKSGADSGAETQFQDPWRVHGTNDAKTLDFNHHHLSLAQRRASNSCVEHGLAHPLSSSVFPLWKRTWRALISPMPLRRRLHPGQLNHLHIDDDECRSHHHGTWTEKSPEPEDGSEIEEEEDGDFKVSQKCFHAGVAATLVSILAIIGLGFVLLFLPDRAHILDRTFGISTDDPTHDVRPVHCHSHNDYWRRVPLFSAISAGCIGVEADIWLYEDDLYVGHDTSALRRNRTLQSLYVNPLLNLLDRQNALVGSGDHAANPSRNTSIASHPHPLPHPRGVFDTDLNQTLTLLIDFKTHGRTLWPRVLEQLEPLRARNYLSYFNGSDVVRGPLTIVATGDAPFDLLTANTTYRYIFYDAPLNQMWDDEDAHSSGWLHWLFGDKPAKQDAVDAVDAVDDEDWTSQDSKDTYKHHQHHHKFPSGKVSTDKQQITELEPEPYSTSNSYYASFSFKKTIGIPWRLHLTHRQIERIRGQIRGAHARGLQARYWSLPGWPVSLRNHIWDVLVREGIDMLNVDDLRGATRREWRATDPATTTDLPT